MRRTALISFRNFEKIFRFIRENGVLIVLLIFFLGGLISGSISYESVKPFSKKLAEFFIGDYLLDDKGGFLRILFDSFFNSLLLVSVCFICGTSMLGVVLAPISMIGCGLIYGYVSALLYSEFSLKGIAFYAVMILPSAVILIIALIMAAGESVRFSLIITKLTFPNSPTLNLSFVFKRFCVRYLFICLLVFFASLVDALLTCYLSGSFVLK